MTGKGRVLGIGSDKYARGTARLDNLQEGRFGELPKRESRAYRGRRDPAEQENRWQVAKYTNKYQLYELDYLLL